MANLSFIKMHGAGNDFIVLDARKQDVAIDAALTKRLCDRHFGIGCDQLLVLEASENADIRMLIYNADGSQIEACGNATRCIGWLMAEEKAKRNITIETLAGVLNCDLLDDGRVKVNMGVPKLEWDEIPLAERRNTEHLGIAEGQLMDPVAVNMGNPHMVFFVRDIDFVRLEESGAKLEKHPLFPKRANVSVAQVIDESHIRLKVWERGTGLTMACGTAACATLVAAVRRQLSQREVTIHLPGGDLFIQWDSTTQEVFMTGAAAYVYRGEIDTASLS